MCDDLESTDAGEDCIKVFVRVRPSFSDGNQCLDVTSPREIVLTGLNPKEFQFDHVADKTTTQDTVFAHVGRQIVESCVAGYNGTIFAYGQTGSGKTYTMLGPGEDSMGNFDHHLRGVIPRSLEYLFDLINGKLLRDGEQFEFECKASFLEIYNEQIFDLLDQCAIRPLQLRESKSGVFVEGITQRCVSGAHEAFKVLSDGWSNRRVASTSMNRESSRSHAVFCLAVETKEHTESVTKVRQSVLNLVDLAGSERQKDTQTSGLQLREAGSINKSLSVLGQVIMALDNIAHGKGRHVPYRNSKLTFLLRDSLGGNAKTYIIVNVHPNSHFFGETMSTLQFAQRAKQIRNKARVNENTQGDVTQLQNEVKRLKGLLSRYRNGGAPESPASVSVNASSGHQHMQGDCDYSEKFFQAMQMLHGRDQLVSALKGRVEKMKKFHMERNYIIKLRNATIASLKGGRTVEKNEEIESLREELEHVQEQVNHHPDIAAYQARVSELQIEVERLARTGLRGMMLQTQEKELENLYSRLLEEHQLLDQSGFTGNKSSLISPPLNGSDKVRMAELEEKLKLKDEELERLKKTNSELEIELSSTKSQVKDLDDIIRATQQSSSSHIRELNKMHESTLRVITTPKHRRRGVWDECSPSPAKITRADPIPCGNLLDLSIPEEDFKDVPMMMDVKMPDNMEDDAENVIQEALQIELQEVKDQLEDYRKDCLDKDRLLAELRQSQSSTNEKLSSSTESISQLKNQLEKLKNEHKKFLEDKYIADLELRDLRILLKSADRELDEERKNGESSQSSWNERLDEMKSSCTKLKNDHCKLEEEKEKVVMEAQTLQDECENQRMELDFIKKELENGSMMLKEEEKKCVSLYRELEEAKAAVKREKESSALLQEQLNGESKRVSEDLENLRNINFELEKDISTVLETSSSLQSRLEEKGEEVEDLKTKRQEDGAAIQALSGQVGELRETYAALEGSHISLRAEHEEVTAEFERCIKDLEKETAALKEKEKSLSEEKCRAKTAQEKHEFEVECLQEDLACWNEQYTALEVTAKTTEAELKNLQKTVEALQVELKENREKLKERDTLILVAEKSEKDKGDFQKLEESLADVSSKYTEQRSKFSQLEAQYKESCRIQSEMTQKHQKNVLEMQMAIEEECREINLTVRREWEKKWQNAVAKEKESSGNAELARQQLEEMKAKVELLAEELEMEKRSRNSRSEFDARLRTVEQQHFRTMEDVKAQLEEAKQMRAHAEQELAKSIREKQDLLQDNSTLAGHRNHLQKIQYLTKLQEKLHVSDEDKRKILQELFRCVTALKKYEPDFKSKMLCGGPLTQRDLNHSER